MLLQSAVGLQKSARDFDPQALCLVRCKRAARKVAVNLGLLVAVDLKIGMFRRRRLAAAAQGLDKDHRHHPGQGCRDRPEKP